MENINKIKNAVFDRATNLFVGSIRVFGNGQFGHSINSLVRSKTTKNLWPCFNTVDIKARIKSETFSLLTVQPGKTLFVEPKARITRDLLRNSGYKITLDREKADYIVIPDPDEFRTSRYVSNLLVYRPFDNSLYQFCVYDRHRDLIDQNNFSENDCSTLRVWLENFLNTGHSLSEPLQMYMRDDFSIWYMAYIPQIESYREILTEVPQGRRYIFDSEVRFQPNNNISVETLEIWSHITDITLLEKCVIGSDWQDYPLTMLTFLTAEHEVLLSSGHYGRNFDMVLDAIHFWESNYPENALVSPQDWNMLQSWIMHKLHLEDDKPGYIDKKAFDNLSPEYKDFLRVRAAVAPMKVNGEIALQNLKVLL